MYILYSFVTKMHTRTLVVILIFGFLICGVSGQTFLQNFVETMSNLTNNDAETARKKKKSGKFMLPLLFGSLLVKSIIFPLAFKAMAIMTSIAVLLSTMSLIISSILGYAKVAVNSESSVKVVRKIPYTTWAKDDNVNTYFNSGENYGLTAPPPPR